MKTTAIAATLAVSIGLLAAVDVSAQYQNSATASSVPATASIVAAITITNTADLAFGQIVAGGTAGTVEMDTSAVRVPTGGVTLANGTAHSSAAFHVTGNGSDTYSVTLPPDSTIELSDGASTPNTMAVDGFSSSPSGAGLVLSSGAQNFTVGAILTVGASQVAGNYTGTFPVTVTYN